MNNDTKSPTYPSKGIDVNLATTNEIKTILEAKTSPRESKADISRAFELIFLPMNLLKRLSQILTIIVISNKINASMSK